MRWVCCVLASFCVGCSGLVNQAPSLLPTLDRCQDVTYERHGQKAKATVDNCTVPTGELAR